MGLNPTILRQAQAFASALAFRLLAATSRHPYRESGLVQGRKADIRREPVNVATSRGLLSPREMTDVVKPQGVGFLRLSPTFVLLV